MAEYTAPGKNNGTVALLVDGEWVKMVWKNRSDTHETMVSAPKELVKRFADEMLKESV